MVKNWLQKEWSNDPQQFNSKFFSKLLVELHSTYRVNVRKRKYTVHRHRKHRSHSRIPLVCMNAIGDDESVCLPHLKTNEAHKITRQTIHKNEYHTHRFHSSARFSWILLRCFSLSQPVSTLVTARAHCTHNFQIVSHIRNIFQALIQTCKCVKMKRKWDKYKKMKKNSERTRRRTERLYLCVSVHAFVRSLIFFSRCSQFLLLVMTKLKSKLCAGFVYI